MAKKFETPNGSDRKRSKDAKRLMKLRKLLGWSQARLAVEWKVSPGTIALWETNTRSIPGPVLKLLDIYEDKDFQDLL